MIQSQIRYRWFDKGMIIDPLTEFSASTSLNTEGDWSSFISI